MTRTNRTRHWRKVVVLALCLVYGLVLLNPTPPDAAVLEVIAVGTMIASFLLNQYRSSGPDTVGTAVFQNRRMLMELHARFDTFGQGLEEIARDVANIPGEVRYDINQALSMYRLHEVDGLRTRIADCAELVKNGEKCDYNLDQLWTDYVAQTAAFFNHGGLAAIVLPELYEFERWYLYVTENDSQVRLRQLRDNYVAAVRKALVEGDLPARIEEVLSWAQDIADSLHHTADLVRRYNERCMTLEAAALRAARGWRQITQFPRWVVFEDRVSSNRGDVLAEAERLSLDLPRVAPLINLYREVYATLIIFNVRSL